MRKIRRKLWWVTRPSRDLRDLKDALSYFYEIAGGKQWYANRDLHKKFEANNPAKTPNYGKVSEGGGGRTWAAWLRMWGLWYDEHCVALTPAGRMIVDVDDPETVHKQIVHLIMRFQITSAYLELDGIEPGFRVFPFQFLIRLLLHKDVEYLTLDEIGLFVLDVKDGRRLETVAGKIKEWRRKETDELRADLIRRRIVEYVRFRADSPARNVKTSEKERLKNSWRPVRDTAHAFADNLSYITEIVYDAGKLSICKGKTRDVKVLLDKYKDEKFISTAYTESLFLKKFGTRYDRRKSSDKETKPFSRSDKQRRRIAEAIAGLKESGRFDESSLVSDVKRITHYPESVIERVVSEDPGLTDDGGDEDFESHYMECAGNGRLHREFEELTRMMFTNMGFETSKRKTSRTGHGNPGEIDGLILNRQTGLSGILECKAGSVYSFSKGDVEKMKHVYIRHFKKKKIDGTQYMLDFFTYVVGRKATSLDNFRGIISETSIRGSMIYANDFLRLYHMHQQKRTNPVRIWGLFKTGKHITRNDILSICD